MNIKSITMYTLFFTTYIPFCFGMESENHTILIDPTIYDFWNHSLPEKCIFWHTAAPDIKRLTIGQLSDVDATAVSITDKNHWQLVQEHRPARQEAARQRKLNLIRLLIESPLLISFDFTPFLHQLQSTRQANNTENNRYIPIIPKKLIWNKNATECACIVKLPNPDHYFLIRGSPYNRNVVRITGLLDSYNPLNHKPYFIDNTRIATLLYDPSDVNHIKLTLPQELNNSDPLFIKIADNSVPASFQTLANFPYLIQECARSAKQSSLSEQNPIYNRIKLCELQRIKLQGFPITPSQQEKIKTIILNNGAIPALDTLSNDQLIQWGIFNQICKNTMDTRRCCNEYHKRISTPILPTNSFPESLPLLDDTSCDSTTLDECTYGTEEQCHTSLKSVLDASYTKTFLIHTYHYDINNTEYSTPNGTLYLGAAVLCMLQKSIVTIEQIYVNNNIKITATPIQIAPNQYLTDAAYTCLNNTNNGQNQEKCTVALLLTDTSDNNQQIDLYSTYLFTSDINKHLKDVLEPSTLQKSYPIPSKYWADKVYFDNNRHKIHIARKPDDLIGQFPTLTINTQTDQQEWTLPISRAPYSHRHAILDKAYQQMQLF